MSVNQMAVFHLHWDSDGQKPMPVRVRLSWQPSDPVAIEATFHTGRTDKANVVWFFSRDLLAYGMCTLTGAGDVRVGPGGPDELRISLSNDSCRADFTVDSDLIADFLAETFSQVPAGTEFDDTDVEHELWCLLLAEGQL